MPTDDRRPTPPLSRWTVTSGSNIQSRGAVILDAGDHQWQASAEGNGAIDALYRAVDQALATSWRATRGSRTTSMRSPRARHGAS